MKIIKKTYQKIFDRFSNCLFEEGGIIGGVNNIITQFEFDIGIPNDNAGCYIPNVDKLNKCICEWQKQNINFYGIIHSHINNYGNLSNDDIKYIKRIMFSISENIQYLYFPVVLPKYTMNSFKAIRIKDEIRIVSDDIIILL